MSARAPGLLTADALGDAAHQHLHSHSRDTANPIAAARRVMFVICWPYETHHETMIIYSTLTPSHFFTARSEPDASGALAAAQRLDEESVPHTTGPSSSNGDDKGGGSGGGAAGGGKDAKWRLRGDEALDELHERYAELRKDHSRLKAQNALLKTGVLDEREKVKSLEAGIEERDRELRRLRAEQDKLLMLNVSYKARIDKLRAELEDESKAKAASGSAWCVPSQELICC